MTKIPETYLKNMSLVLNAILVLPMMLKCIYLLRTITANTTNPLFGAYNSF